MVVFTFLTFISTENDCLATLARVSSGIDAHEFSFSCQMAATVAGFLRYSTSFQTY